MNTTFLLSMIGPAMKTIATLTEFVRKTTEALKQSGELSVEQRAQLDREIASLEGRAHWRREG